MKRFWFLIAVFVAVMLVGCPSESMTWRPFDTHRWNSAIPGVPQLSISRPWGPDTFVSMGTSTPSPNDRSPLFGVAYLYVR